jgi:hypothetical protein
MTTTPASPAAVALMTKGFECWNGGEIDEKALRCQIFPSKEAALAASHSAAQEATSGDS